MLRIALTIFAAVTVVGFVIQQHRHTQRDQAAPPLVTVEPEAIRMERERHYAAIRDAVEDELDLELEFARKRFEKGRMAAADWEQTQERIDEKLAIARKEYEDGIAGKD